MNLQTEPARLIGALTGLVTAVLALLVAAGVNVSDDMQAAVLGLLAASAPIVSAVLIRGRVWSPASHEAAVDAERRQRMGG